jgi:transposase-like protein
MIDGIEDVVIGLYARGMNTRDIEDQIRDIYKIDISETTVSNITSRVGKNADDKPSSSL